MAFKKPYYSRLYEMSSFTFLRYKASASRELRTRDHRNEVMVLSPRQGASRMKQAVRTDAHDFGATPPRSASMCIKTLLRLKVSYFAYHVRVLCSTDIFCSLAKAPKHSWAHAPYMPLANSGPIIGSSQLLAAYYSSTRFVGRVISAVHPSGTTNRKHPQTQFGYKRGLTGRC